MQRPLTHASQARALLIDTVWRNRPDSDADELVLRAAAALARHNLVDGPFARAHGDRLPHEMTRVTDVTNAFRANLRDATGRLVRAGVRPILIKADPRESYTYTNFDLVVGDDGWEQALRALDDWGVRTSTHRLEQSKLLVHPAHGPAAHLHRAVSWFDVPIISAPALRAGATHNPDESWWEPSPADALRILLAHALFQNLAVDLSELLAIRRLLDARVEQDARIAARTEGWARGFDHVLHLARTAIRGLDHGTPVRLPVPIPMGPSLAGGLEHATSLWRSGSARIAAREAALRVPLIVAKRKGLAVM